MINPDGSNQPLVNGRSSVPPLDQTPVNGALGINGFHGSHGLPHAPASASNASPTIGTLLVALKRRWLLASALGCVAAVFAVAAVAYAYPPKYVTKARLELSKPRQHQMFVAGLGGDDGDPGVFRANQLGIIKSPLVLNAALNSEKVKTLSMARLSPDDLEKNLKADFTQGPEIMSIALHGNEPESLGILLNEVIDAYRNEMDNRDNVRRKLLLKQLNDSLKDLTAKLHEKRQELAKAEKDHNLPDTFQINAKMQNLAAKSAGIEAELRTVSSDLAAKNSLKTATLARLTQADRDIVPFYKIKVQVYNSPAMQTFVAKIALIDGEIANWASAPDSPQKDSAMAALQDQRKGLETSAKNTENALRPEYEGQYRAEAKETMEHEIRTLDENINRLKSHETGLRDDYSKAIVEYNFLSALDRQGNAFVNALRDDVKQMEKTRDIVAGQVSLLKAEPPASSKIVKLQEAEAPTDRDYSRFMKIGTAAGCGAFGLVLFAIAFLEFRLRKISDTEDVTHGLGLPLVGTMPKLPAQARRPLNGAATEQVLHWQSLITESVDAIRTQLLHAARADGVQIVMVTSASGGEGKTSLASQLAASLARAWRKTLLVDGDLRNPAAHKLFNLDLEPGFSEVLRGEANVADVVKPTLLSRLSLLSAGQWDAQAMQALAQDGVHPKFEQMKEQYDFIIVDSPPVLPVADTLLLGQHVDAVIFSVLRDVSRLPSLQLAKQKLQNLGVRVLGAVVIGADSDRSSLDYRYSGIGSI